MNRAVEYVQLSEEMALRFMAAVRRMKQAYNLCSSSDKISDRETDYIHFYSWFPEMKCASRFLNRLRTLENTRINV